jgi:uncharacterized protein YhjY with autotransporter beta-barrel domain
MHRIRSSFGVLLLASAAVVATSAHAQSGTDAFTAQFNAICAGATPGSALAARCAVVLASADPNARALAANFNDLEEIPGAGRGNARDTAPDAATRNQARTQLTPKLALFASIDDSHTSRSLDTIEAAFDADALTLTLGLDWHPADAWQLGLALDHAREQQDFRGSSGALQAHYTGVLAIAGWNANAHVAVNGYAGRLQGGQDLRRVVNFIDGSTPIAETASPGADRTLAGIALDANLARGAWEWRGAIGYDAARTAIDAYTERGGSGFDLSVPARSTDTRRGRLDAALAGTFPRSWGVWQPEFRVGLRHEFGNAARLVGVRLLDDGSATVVRFTTGAPDRDWLQAGVSTVFTFSHGQSAFVALDREFGHSTSTATMLAIGWRMELQ